MLTEQQIHEAFGVEPKPDALAGMGAPAASAAAPEAAEAPGEAQETPQGHEGFEETEAAPAETRETEAAPAEPRETEETAAKTHVAPGDAGDAGEPAAPVGVPGHLEQLRREQQEAVAKAVSEALAGERARQAAELEEMFTKARLKNTITDAPIKSVEDFKAWEREYSAALMEQELQAGKLTPETLNRAIAESPPVRRAEEFLLRQQEAERERSEREMKQRADAELSEIMKLDPAATSLETILKMPTGRAFYEAVQRGNSFLDAFKLANWERLTMAAAAVAEAAAKQQAITSIQGKDHLKAGAKPRGGGCARIAKEEIALYRALNPGDSDADIRAYYERTAKSS